ncbi:hypothetical protein AS590_07040 [Prescottella equi]|nr:hypothetical protein AOT96_16280 [Rhodococcus sp. 008]AUS30684.1 hypothetical protein C1M55_05850 [Rhodococcus qingshengii]EME17150.1 hypothetical protein G418_25311 [Rhodococcus qingshengii BKS 20-40]KLN72857.1 hypothetical protein ABM90_04595 [Rhodococcus erythropolis]MBW0287952.1 hypothetical protein [Rhodococcus sp. FH8]OCC18000.1 hypothetical protein AS590_07040 [Prescottella equi]OFE09141.1 hypothetical protein A5N83_09160 [Rhodococcus sp. 1139]OMQ25880.1 hypothetical protein BK799_
MELGPGLFAPAPGLRRRDDEDDRMTDKDDNDQSPKGGHPGPVDKGGDGGMATREQAPELVEETSGEKSDDE